MELTFEDLGVFYWLNFIAVAVAGYYFFKSKPTIAAGWICVAHLMIMIMFSLWSEIYLQSYGEILAKLGILK